MSFIEFSNITNIYNWRQSEINEIKLFLIWFISNQWKMKLPKYKLFLFSFWYFVK